MRLLTVGLLAALAAVLLTEPALAQDALPATVKDGFSLAVTGDLIGPEHPITGLGDPGTLRIVKLLSGADVAFGNQEGAIFDLDKFSGYPAAQNGGGTPINDASVAFDLKAMGFKIMSLANNHATDFGVEGLRETRRSLDAAPRARARRYRLRDPFLAFWFRFVLPNRHRFADATADALYAEVVRPQLDRHVASVFPQVCRDFMANDAIEVLGANARECGSLWGGGYDIPVAGVLGTGAPFYGLPVTDEEGSGGSLLPGLDAGIRETRYGFGRERRLRLLFLTGEASPALLRESARRHDSTLVSLDALAGVG